MGGFFSPDNAVWKVMGRVADVFVLSVIWAVCSLPVVTIGASTTALYYVTLRMAEKRDGYLVQTFLRAFRENLVSSTLVWLPVVLVGSILGNGIWFSGHSQTDMGRSMIWFFLISGVLYAFLVTVIFPLSARLDTKPGNLLLMAFMVCIRKFGWVMFMCVITVCMTAVGLFVFWPLLVFVPGAAALFHSIILVHMVFPAYHWNLENASTGREQNNESVYSIDCGRD